MLAPPKSRQVQIALLSGVSLLGLGLGGCRAAGPGGSGMAPTLASGDAAPVNRNVADPNAPFIVKAAHPVLATREPILDINGVPPCLPSQLTAFESGAQTVGRNHSLRISIVNRQDACRLGGFPSVALLDAHGDLLGNIGLERVSHDIILASLRPATQPVTSNGNELAPSPQVLLATKGEADFELGWTSGPECAEVSRIAIAAPGTTESIVMGRVLQICGNKLLITAVSPPDAFHQ